MDEPLIRYKNVNINQQELDVLEDVNLEHQPTRARCIGRCKSGTEQR